MTAGPPTRAGATREKLPCGGRPPGQVLKENADGHARGQSRARLLTLPGPSWLLGRRGGSSGKAGRRRGRAVSSEGGHFSERSQRTAAAAAVSDREKKPV